MTGELVVPVLISLGLMTIMLKALAFPEFSFSVRTVHGTLRMADAEHPQVAW